LGEVLWDVFPTHKQLGGAPANFAYISGLLGDDGMVASRIGADALGDEVVAQLQGLGLDESNLQRDAAHATGTVKVEIESDGQPLFEISKDVAWDFLEWTPQWQALAQKADAVCFGSLAQRGLQSRETIRKFLSATREDAARVFDVNLRQAFYSAEVLANSAERADILKLNHEEVPIVVQAVGGPKVDELRSAQWLCRRFGLKLVCVTRGSSGSLLVTNNAHAEHPGYNVTVVDTVGAGDAFTATMVHHYLRGSSLATMNDAANQMGAWVASKSGATPAMEAEQISRARAS
jgi:fructokinase